MAKYKIRKTGEVVDVIAYSGFTGRDVKHDFVSYIDSEGVEHPREKGLNIYWDFIEIPEEECKKSEIDWEQRRYEIAKQMLSVLSERRRWDTNELISRETAASSAVKYADALIEELKKK